MSRKLAVVVVLSTVIVSGTLVQAENAITRSWNKFCAVTMRNNAWPEAFIPVDRAAARAPFGGCVAAGWRVQNTLDDYHFEPDTGKLLEAGTIKVRKIMTEAPIGYRTVFVLRANTAAETASRITATQEAAVRYALPGDHPMVGETYIQPRGMPAYYIVDIDRSFRESTPEPRIPEGSRGSSSSSSSSAGT
jgi:hypothetical protein